MDLKIYQQENALRNANDATKIAAYPLIPFSKAIFPEKMDVSDKCMLVKGNEGEVIKPNEFNRRFYKLTRGLLNYIEWDNIVVAGGCVSNAINSTYDCRYPTDIDLFIYGSTLTEDEVRERIKKLIKNICEFASDNLHTSMYILKNDYVISLIPKSNQYRKCKVQIILRMYRSIQEILIGFDIDSCAVAYDGDTVLFTPRSLNVFGTRMNVVDLSRRSPSYEFRLFKYYQRGFGIYIPFDFRDGYNKLYFLNKYTKGIDKLMYFIKFQNTSSTMKFLNYMTQRRNLKMRAKKICDYEDEELDLFNAGDIRNYLVKYNKSVANEYKYQIIDNSNFIISEYRTVQLMVQNPGKQLTGSFHPITEGDWIDVNYSLDGHDFIGRNVKLLDIKYNKNLAVNKYYNINVYDNSLFNPLCYMIFYSLNEDPILDAWNNKHQLCKNRNLYDLSYLDLAIMMNRQMLVKHILEKTKITIYKSLVTLCIKLDNIEMFLLLKKHFSFGVSYYKNLMSTYNSENITNHFCITMEQKDSLIAKMKNMTSDDRALMFNKFHMTQCDYYVRNIKNFFDKIDYQTFSVTELRMIIKLRRNIDELYIACIGDIIHEITIEKGHENIYEKGSFEYYWYEKRLNDLKQREKSKDIIRHQYALKVIKELFREKDLKKELIVVFTDPVIDIDPFHLNMMKICYKKDTNLLKKYPTSGKLWDDNFKNLRDHVISLDDIDVLKCFAKNKTLENFLKQHYEKLGASLKKYIDEINKEKINIRKDYIYEKYATAFKNNHDHISVLKDGILSRDCKREENVFGYTPSDYIINQILYLCTKSELSEYQLYKLCNLRKSLRKIEALRQIPITPIKKTDCCNPEIEDIISRI